MGALSLLAELPVLGWGPGLLLKLHLTLKAKSVEASVRNVDVGMSKPVENF